MFCLQYCPVNIHKNGRKLYFTHNALRQTSLILSKMIHYTEVVSIMYNVDPVQINNLKIKTVLTYVIGEDTHVQDRRRMMISK
jgi:hypothetical protein